ncbi:PorP/SprF family type IX secretion system membrane protein [Williamwhitmania taraxaci]|uniref:Type IX secretion system membrane protein, PorP/SprF family n=1 Tax=Williamwhitmania taraxaci TaxID=1640674 RepID=A0A1G6LWE5_9BACT|nr:type IX secretion system membrane protein PorP/SprF [Williamwhitmania taraxaci]SDC47384.1 type IX secretion system membrane protein, PorP/SprF family [Williamwhitmania taraxaci]
MKGLKKIRVGLVVLGILSTGRVFGQQEPIYSQYMMNSFLLNPAVAGAEGFTAFNLTARQQWAGYSEGPRTFAISGQTRILKTSYMNRSRRIKNRVRKRRPSGRVGFGWYMFNDVNGRVSRTGVQGTYAYHLDMRQYQLSFGASLSFYQFKADVAPSGLPYPDQQDPLVMAGKANADFSPDANFGVMLSSASAWYAGFSVSNLVQSSIQFGVGNKESAYRMLRHYYLIGGYRYDFRNDFEIEPSMKFTTTERLSYTTDINVKGYYKRDYWAGLSYRTSGSAIVMVGAKYKSYYIGYAFDYGFGQLTNFNSLGTHELMVGIKIGDSARRYRWLNRF